MHSGLENKTANTIKITSLKYSISKKNRGQVGVATSNPIFFFGGNSDYDRPKYLGQELFLGSREANSKIDPDKDRRINCYIPKSIELIKIKLASLIVGKKINTKRRVVIYAQV